MWRGSFTSISAFCNAGFALQTESLIPYQNQPIVLHVVSALIILGGISPAVVFALPEVWRRRERRAQVWLVLAATGILLAVDTVLIGAIEWSRTLGHLGLLDRIQNAWFQAVTLRTAGFNSVDLAASHPATLAIMMISMFIGGSPGGTAGGIKTTTFALASMSIVHQMFGRPKLTFRWKEVPLQAINRTAAVISLSLMAVGLSAFLILIFDPQLDPLQVAFESFSAYGTVGLSLGITAELSAPSKLVLVATMFLGRVGFLTLLSGIARQLAGEHLSNYQYPAEPIFIN